MAKAGMEMPNWFDNEYEGPFEKATAEQMLALIAKNARVVQAVKTKLAERDASSKKSGWAGPSRTQTGRSAIAEVLQEVG